MCIKILVRLFSKTNSNCSLSYLYTNKYNINERNICFPNLTQLSVSYSKLCVLPKTSHYIKYCSIYKDAVLSSIAITKPACFRSYSSKREQDLPKIMEFPQVVWPSMFKTLRNWVLSNFIIMRYFDNEFNLPDFVIGSKQAVALVSGMISRGDVESLTGLVTPEVIEQVRTSLSTFTLKQRQEFAISEEDIYFCFPYEVGVMFPNEDKNEGESQSRFVEITMCYHMLHGLTELKEAGVNLPVNMGLLPEYKDKIFICNYRFIREFTKGVQDDWTINAINHFKPSDMI